MPHTRFPSKEEWERRDAEKAVRKEEKKRALAAFYKFQLPIKSLIIHLLFFAVALKTCYHSYHEQVLQYWIYFFFFILLLIVLLLDDLVNFFYENNDTKQKLSASEATNAINNEILKATEMKCVMRERQLNRLSQLSHDMATNWNENTTEEWKKLINYIMDSHKGGAQ